MDFMAQFPDKHFELAIVDPPYFNGPNKSGYYGKGYSNLGVKRAAHYTGTGNWKVPKKRYFKELFRVSQNRIIWGANHFAEKFKSNSSCWIIWDKDNGNSTFADAELAYSSFKSAARIFKYTWNGMHQGSMGGNVKLNEKRIHPTQKPVALYEWLLKNYAKDGDKILDTHMGSQSSRIAAWKYGFDYWGSDLDDNYFREGCKRFKKISTQPLLLKEY
jgi:site-specific DNA-methyltransferase (adenine-specific)